MKRNFTRITALFLVIVTILMALPITASATSSSSRCRHSRTRNATYEIAYEAISSAEHLKTRYRKEVCRSCDNILDTWTEEKEQSHTFENGICEDCGYQRTVEDIIVDENIIVLQDEETHVKVQGNDEYWEYPPVIREDRTMVPITIAVEYLGGEFLYWDSETSSAYIELNEKIIEFQKGTEYYWVDGEEREANVEARIIDGKLYVELKALVRRAKKTLAYHEGYIVISEDDLADDEIEKVIGYLYEGKTYDNESNLDDIIAGKVYATSSDGKHIYKRIYDASKTCGYSDIYVCTIFNIDLPSNTILIQEGNYLYDNGKKVYADIVTLQTADKRISQLNRIIDGANNARDNGVITKSRRNTIRNNANDIIDEYKKVAWGEKAISRVSENTVSYVAKTGDNNNTVEIIQQKLYDLGYTSQLVTGYYGDITFNNVAYFQIVNNLTVTGWVDSTTYNTIVRKNSNTSEGYFECDDETFSDFDITALEFEGSEYINVVVDMLGGKELLNEIGQQILDSMPEISQEDLTSFAWGIVSSADDNVLFGAGKVACKLLGKFVELPDVDASNYYYCFSKHYTDQFFIGFYTVKSAALATGAIKSLAAGIGSGGIAIACAATTVPSFGATGPAAFTVSAVAVSEIATGLVCVAGTALNMGLLYHSQNVAYASGQNLAKANKPVSSSAKLSGAMQQAGKSTPSYSNYAAHHIVPEHASKAARAREILENCGIYPNDAVNGVYLPTKAGQVGAGNATIHSGRHTNAYIDYVTQTLEFYNPQDYASCKKVLDAIAEELLNGTLKLGK